MRKLALILCVTMVFGLCGCKQDTQVKKETEENVTLESLVEEADNTLSLSELEVAKIRNKYADVLSAICDGGKYPEEESYTWNENLMGYHEANTYTICDINKDGVEELIINFTDGSMAEMMTMIYSYDLENDTLVHLLTEFPGIRYYDNNMIKADDSHNHGLGNIIWPYTLYQYNEEQKAYEIIGVVDSWNKELHPQDYDGTLFPEDEDTDKDGNVFLVPDVNGGQYSTVLDNEEFKKWEKERWGSGNQILLDADVICHDNFFPYITDYHKLLDESVKIDEDAIDFGKLAFQCEGKTYEETNEVFMSMFVDKLGLTIVETGNEEDVKMATLNGEEYISMTMFSGGNMTYVKALDKVTVFGVCPGMTIEEADAALRMYGFYNPMEEGWYISGIALGNYTVYMEIENGIVTSVSLGPYSDFAG